MALTEAEDIKKRWQEYTEELYKKDFHDPDDHYGVITNLDGGNLSPWVVYQITVMYFRYPIILSVIP